MNCNCEEELDNVTLALTAGSDGDDATYVTLDNDATVVSTDSAGAGGVFTNIYTVLRFYLNGVEQDISDGTGVTVTLSATTVTESDNGDNGRRIKIDTLTSDNGYVDATYTYGGVAYTKRFDISRALAGDNNTIYNDLTLSTQAGVFNALVKNYTFAVSNLANDGDKVKFTTLLDISATYDGTLYFSFNGAAIGIEYAVTAAVAQYIKIELIINRVDDANTISDCALDATLIATGGASTRMVDPIIATAIDLDGTPATYVVGVHSNQTAGTINVRQFSIDKNIV